MRVCVIVNPVARGVRRKGACLHEIERAGAAIYWTSRPGEARVLAARAVQDGCELVVAAGGDGTVNEVVNGIGDVPGGWGRVRLAVLPLGTANVWARELGMPLDPERAWRVLTAGQERCVDVAWAEWPGEEGRRRRYFVQLAGAGWDARAIERVRPGLKRWLGPWAYVWAGWVALWRGGAPVTVDLGAERSAGPWVLAGNGRLYGGPFELFPGASPGDGWLEVCVVPRLTVALALAGGLWVLLRRRLPERWVIRRRARRLRWVSERPVPFELDGEWAGWTPVELGLCPGSLRVVA
jgi:diacylglycerol kinase family enzyme